MTTVLRHQGDVPDYKYYTQLYPYLVDHLKQQTQYANSLLNIFNPVNDHHCRRVYEQTDWRATIIHEEEDVGFVFFSCSAKLLHIHEFYIIPSYRSRGIGKRVLDELEAMAKQQGLTYTTLCVSNANPRAAAMYQQQGYIPRYTEFVKTLS